MKILLIDVNYKNSSTGKIVYDLSERLKSDGYTSKVLYGRGNDINNQYVHKIAPTGEILFHAAMTRITGLVGNYSFLATKNVINEIEDFKPDVVHLHELHGYYINIESIVNYLNIHKIPIVWTFHCEFMYTGKCGYSYDCEKWKTECNKCPQLKEYPSSLFFDFTNFMFNQKKSYMQKLDNLRIITPSRWLADRVKLSFLKDKNIDIIHNGIDTTNIFYPRDVYDLNIKHNINGRKVILAVAPNIMDDRKGGKWVLELASRFGKDIVFIMVGLEKEIQNLPENIITIQKTENQNELAKYYSLADLFLICSKKENFPTTCLEALACGTPIIGFDEGGTAETAPDGFGKFVSYGNINELQNIISRFCNGDIILKDSIACRSFAVNNYSKEAMYANYLKVYKNIFK